MNRFFRNAWLVIGAVIIIAVLLLVVFTDRTSTGLDLNSDISPQHSCPLAQDRRQDSDGDTIDDLCDIDDDGDGLIEIATAAELDAIRHQLNGTGRRLAADGPVDRTGCGNGGDITTCNGYELVADISLVNYTAGEGWQPLGYGTDVDTAGCQGVPFRTLFEGNNHIISDLAILRETQDCIGLFGYISSEAEIRNLHIQASEVIGRIAVGTLVGDAQRAKITSSSASVDLVGGGIAVGGLIGDARQAEVSFSSATVKYITGLAAVGGLIGFGDIATILSSHAVAGVINGTRPLFGNYAAGLTGTGGQAVIVASYAMAEVIVGDALYVGGLMGDSDRGTLVVASYAVTKSLGGNQQIGGLAGHSAAARIKYSYVLANSIVGEEEVGALVGGTDGSPPPIVNSSYWDSSIISIKGRSISNFGTPHTTTALQSPTDYNGIYSIWDDGAAIGDENPAPITRWCDTNRNGKIDPSEQTDANRIWDFGTSQDYPAIRCTEGGTAAQRQSYGFNDHGELMLNLFNNE